MTSTSKPRPQLRFISLSDVHLGHPHTSTEHIVANLDKYLPDTEAMRDVDVIFLVGDLFDRLLSFEDVAAIISKRWMRRLLKMCKRFSIKVRVLRGTPSHDRHQLRWMEEANEGIDAQLRYIDVLSVEHIDDLDIDVLYVPDEWKHETDETWKDVCDAMQTAGVEKVDFTLLHGTWEHQLPAAAVNVPRHNPQRYLDITRHYVLSGHIHMSSRYEDRLLTNGSFDRIAHGEEGSKGFWDVTMRDSGDAVVFVENHDAQIYKTVDCTGLDIDEVLNRLEEQPVYPTNSHMRIAANKNDAALASMDVIKRKYPRYRWSVKPTKKEDRQRNLLVDLRANFTPTLFTRENLGGLVLARVRTLHQDPAVLAECERLLKEVM